jgi:hypothetical protein
MMSEYHYDVFLSHNSRDKPAIEWLAAKLEDQAGIKVFLDKWNLVPGDSWQEDLENALQASQAVAVFLGPTGISGWHNEELRSALTTRVSGRGRRVIPVLLPGTTMPEDDQIPAFLQRLTWVDFRKGLDDDEAFIRLVAGIKGEAPGRPGKTGQYHPPPKPAPKSKEKASAPQTVNTGGGDFVGRDKKVTAGGRGVAIGGSVSGSTIITGDHNVVGSTVNLQQAYLQQIFYEIEKQVDLDPLDKEDLKSEIKELQSEDGKGPDADETRISRHLRNIKRMAPDILELVIAAISNPLAGFGAVTQKVIEQMGAEMR